MGRRAASPDDARLPKTMLVARWFGASRWLASREAPTCTFLVHQFDGHGDGRRRLQFVRPRRLEWRTIGRSRAARGLCTHERMLRDQPGLANRTRLEGFLRMLEPQRISSASRAIVHTADPRRQRAARGAARAGKNGSLAMAQGRPACRSSASPPYRRDSNRKGGVSSSLPLRRKPSVLNCRGWRRPVATERRRQRGV